MRLAYIRQPLGALAPDSCHNLTGIKCLSFIGDHADGTVIFDENIFNHGHKLNVHTGFKKVLLNPCIDFIAFFCAKMTDRTFDQL